MKTVHSLSLLMILATGLFGQAPFFETNDPGSSLTIDNAQGTSTTPVVLTRCIGTTVNAVLSSTSTLGWDIGVCSVPLMASSGSPGGQAVNLNIAHPTFRLAFNGTFAFPFPGPLSASAPANLSFPTPAFPLFSFQMVNLNPAHPDGASLSQGVQLNSVLGIAQAGPVPLDSSVLVNLAGPPLCAAGPVAFYGVVYTQAFMASNGRICFLTANNDFTPNISEALTENPFVAPLWADLVMSSTGIRDIQFSGSSLLPLSLQSMYSSPTTQVLRFRWLNNLSGSNLVSVEAYYVYNTGQWILHRTTTPAVGTISAFVGISRGSTGATNPGQQSFAPNATGPVGGANSNAMLYKFAAISTVWGNAQTIIFTPANGFAPSGAAPGYNGYNWAAF